MDKIKGKIASIVTNNTVIINKGKKDGILLGMQFNVLLPIPDVHDPDDYSNYVSGLSFNKGKIEVSQLFEGMSYAFIVGKYSNSYQDPMLTLPNVDEKQILLPPSEWQIKAGDEIVLETEPENKKK